MRQAGRTDPAYNQLKEEAGLPLEDLFRHPEYAAQISLLPKRFGVDAIIFFQDILTMLAPMGAPFLFRPGPVCAAPVCTREDVDALQPVEPARDLPFVGETFHRLSTLLDGEMPVLGFAGAPLTLLVFLTEGKSFGNEAPAAKMFLNRQPEAAHALLEKLTEATIAYLKYQVNAGAAAVQLFESAAYLLNGAEYRAFALPYQQRIFAALRGVAPTIHFARECGDLALLDEAGADIISLPAGLSITQVRAQLGVERVLQGNLDNHLLAHGNWSEIEAAAAQCLIEGARTGHIFNLSHGLLRETPFGHVTRLVDFVHNFQA
jgi:uroporphyrinogen decarboxylase